MALISWILFLIPAVLSILIAVHLHRRYRSPVTIALLAGAAMILATYVLQLVPTVIFIFATPVHESMMWGILSRVGVLGAWPGIIGNVIFFIALYVLTRRLCHDTKLAVS